MREMLSYTRANGFKASVKKYGWKFLAPVILYYLVRDLFLYVALPLFLLH